MMRHTSTDGNTFGTRIHVEYKHISQVSEQKSRWYINLLTVNQILSSMRHTSSPRPKGLLTQNWYSCAGTTFGGKYL